MRAGIAVYAGDALLGGLVSERYLGIPAPTLAELLPEAKLNEEELGDLWDSI